MRKNRKVGFLSMSLGVLLLLNTSLLAQIGGKYSFEFLSLTQSARSTALNGGIIATKDSDVALAYANPALLNSQMHNQVTINHNFHFADISHGFVNYGRHMEKWGIDLHGGINYINYGEFTRADEFGNQEGTFDASEVALTLGAARKVNERMMVGLNMKLASSRLESYTAFGLAYDLGFLYENPDKLFNVALVVKNVGFALKNYSGSSTLMPIDIQVGFSKRFEHLPFRFSVTTHSLNLWDLRYDNPNDVDPISIFGTDPTATGGFSSEVDNLFRHMIFSGEFLIGKSENVVLRFGYNHQRRKELAVSQFRSLGGFSLGFGIKVKKIRLDYGVGYYHLAGGVNHLSLGIDLSRFGKKLSVGN